MTILTTTILTLTALTLTLLTKVGRFKEAFSVPEPGEVAQVVGGAAKKQKVEKAGVPETTADWLQCWQDRLLDKQTVPVLKDFCKSRALQHRIK